MAKARGSVADVPVFTDADLQKINAALIRIADVREFLARVKRAGLPTDEQAAVLDLYDDQLRKIKAEFFPQAR